MTPEDESPTTLTFVFDADGPRGVRIGDFFWALGQNHRGRLPATPPWPGYCDGLPRKLSLRLFDLWFLASRRLRPGGPLGVLVAELAMLPSWNTHEARGEPEQNAIAWIRNRGSDSVSLSECELGALVEPAFEGEQVRYEPAGAEVPYARTLDIAIGRAVLATTDPWLPEHPAWPRLYGVGELRVVPDFTGRERELTQLRDRLLAANASSPPPVALCGPSGMGKTQLVAAFLTRHAARFENVIVVHASGTDLTASIGRWASVLDEGAPVLRSPLQDAERVREVLERAGPSLLVLDDVTDERAATSWLPRRGPCRVIMTSQLPLVDGARPIHVDPLSPDDAAELLTWHMPGALADLEERAAVEAICDYFGRSPFALHVAGVHMGRHRIRPPELLAKIGSDGPGVISESGVDVAGYSRSVNRVLGLPFKQLAADMPTRTALGEPLPRVAAWVCGLLAPSPAPRALVASTIASLAGDDTTPADIEDALGALERRSLIRGDRREIDVHGLLGRFFEANIPADKLERVVDAFVVELAALTRRFDNDVTLLPHVTRARGVVGRLPLRAERHAAEAELLTWEAAVQMQAHGYASAESAPVFARAAEIAARMPPTPSRFVLLFMCWVPALIEARLDDARDLALELRRLAASLRVPTFDAAAAQALGAVLSFRGEHAEASPILERGVALADAAPTARSASRQAQDPRVTCRCDLARSVLLMGRPDAAMALIAEAREIGRAHPFSHAFALFNATMAHQYRREPEAAHEAAQELLAVCARYGFRQFDIDMAMERVELLNARIARMADTTLLAELHLDARNVPAARAALARAEDLLRTTGEAYYAPEYHRLTALALAYGSDAPVPEAEARLVHALALARSQGARWHELRILTSLGQLRRRRGDLSTAEALRACLALVTEGGDLPTVREARGELDAHEARGA